MAPACVLRVTWGRGLDHSFGGTSFAVKHSNQPMMPTMFRVEIAKWPERVL